MVNRLVNNLREFEKEIKDANERIDPRCRISLSNMVKMAFHPRGWRDYMDGCNEDMNPEGGILSQINNGAAFTFDMGKYVMYTALVGSLIYGAIK